MESSSMPLSTLKTKVVLGNETSDQVPISNYALTSEQRIIKRIFDIIISSIVIFFILIWLIPLIGILIKLGSKGPVITRQARTGLSGRIFDVYKFRTMYVSNAPFRQSGYNDHRVTPIGRFLRRTNLDEMPQFINVLLGDMSVVGPRPHPIQLDAELFAYVPNYYDRYSTKPGIVGLAQSRAGRVIFGGVLNTKHVVKFDLFYIKHWSLFLDIKLLFFQIIDTLKGPNKAW